jgi:hypothetical protein
MEERRKRRANRVIQNLQSTVQRIESYVRVLEDKVAKKK